jgi:capsular polysaccharide transport system permease protein
VKRLLSLLSSRNLRVALIGVPLVLAAVYLTFFASNRYVTESVIAVRQSGDRPANIDVLSSLFGASAPTSRADEMMLEAHILSIDMLQELDKRLSLRQHFSGPALDWIFRLPTGATQEQLLEYYRSRVEVVLEDESGLLRVRTQGFTPELAQALNRELLAASERFINESSHRLAREQMSFAETELGKARVEVDKAKSALLAFQRKNGVLDPLAQMLANSGLTAELQGTLARQEAEMKGLLGYLNEEASQVNVLRTQIEATRAQLGVEGRRAITNGKGASLNMLAGEYQELLAQAQFAQDSYRLALTGLETARIESTRKLKSLVLVESPVKPESAEYPRRLYTLFAMLIGLTLLYGIARLVVATIEDHQE